MQNAAVEALKCFVPAYLVNTDDKRVDDFLSKYLEQLRDPNVAARRGSALAIRILPLKFLAKRWNVVLPKLCSACMIEVHLCKKLSMRFLQIPNNRGTRWNNQSREITVCRITLKIGMLKHG